MSLGSHTDYKNNFQKLAEILNTDFHGDDRVTNIQSITARVRHLKATYQQEDANLQTLVRLHQEVLRYRMAHAAYFSEQSPCEKYPGSGYNT